MTNRSRKKQTRKRKRDLVAPNCQADCQRGHNVEQAAALIGISVPQLWRLVDAGRIEYADCSAGEKGERRYIFISHPTIRKFFQSKAA
jgi:hypothetical protein